jgi:ABC-2 type transport system ATP-binding protein
MMRLPMERNDVAASLEGLCKNYGEFAAVSDVAFEVGRGERFALLGPNGAGKTTTIRMLMGILEPTAGTARILGHDCFSQRAEVMRHVGYLPDEPIFYDYLRGREVLEFVMRMRGISDDPGALQRRDALIGRFELGDDLEEFAVNYSKGMKKKLAIVAALLHDPRFLILDEPTNGLDPYATRVFHDLIREQSAEGRSVLFSTHLLDQAERLCHRVAIMERGRIAALGPLDELKAQLAPGSTLEDLFFRVTARDDRP